MNSEQTDKRILALRLLQSLNDPENALRADQREALRQAPLSSDEVVVVGVQRRGNRRFNDPMLRVIINKVAYDTVDWSLSGIKLRNYNGLLKSKMRCTVMFCHPSPGSPYHSALARVVRVEEKRHYISFRFEKLSEGAFDFLSGLQLSQLRRGRANSASA